MYKPTQNAMNLLADKEETILEPLPEEEEKHNPIHLGLLLIATLNLVFWTILVVIAIYSFLK